MSFNIDALQLLIQVRTQGKEALAEILDATRKQIAADKEANSAGASSHAALVRSNLALLQVVQARAMIVREAGLMEQRTNIDVVRSLNPVLSAQLQLKAATEQSSTALVRYSDVRRTSGQTAIEVITPEIVAEEKLRSTVEGTTGALVRQMNAIDATRKRTTDAGSSGGGDGIGGNGGAGGSGMFDGLENLIGKVRGNLGKISAGIGAVIAVAGTAKIALNNVANATGKLAEEQLNMAERTGLSVREIGLYSSAARVAGVDVQAFTMSMRTLSRALSENSAEGKLGKEALNAIGVSAYDAAGKAKPMGQLWLELAAAFGKIEDPVKRADAAVKIFGHSGLELLPLLRGNFRELITEVEALGVAFTEEGAKKAAAYDDQLDKLGERWAALKRSFGEKAIGIIEVAIKAADFVADWPKLGGLKPRGAAALAGIKDLPTPPVAGAGITDLMAEAEAAGQKLPALTGGADPSKIRAQLFQQNSEQIEAVKRSLKGTSGEISEINAQIEKLQNTLKDDVFPVVNAPILAEINALKLRRDAVEAGEKARKDALEAAKKAQQELDAANKQAASSLREAQLAELSGLAKLRAERDAAIEQAQKLGAVNAVPLHRAAADTRGNMQAQAELLRMQDGLNLEANSSPELRAEKQAIAEQAGAIYLASKRGEESLDSLIEKLGELNAKVQEVLVKQDWFDAQTKRSDAFSEKLRKDGDVIKANIDRLRKDETARRQPQRDVLELQQKEIADNAARNIRLTQAHATPGSEYSTLDTIRRIKEQAAAEEYQRAMSLAELHLTAAERQKDEARALAALKASIDDAELDRISQISELRRREIEEFKQSAGRIYDALARDGSAGLGNFARQFAQTFQRTIFQNAAGEIFNTLKNQLNLGGMIGGQVDKSGNLNGLGRLLKGTPLGVDQSKVTIDQNTVAVKQQTGATQELNAATVELISSIKSGTGSATPGGVDSGKLWTEDNTSVDALKDSKYGGFFKDIAKYAGLAGGAFGVYAGIRQGGAGGAMTAVAAGAGAAAMFTPEPISKGILTGVAIASGFVATLLRRSNDEFDREQSATLERNKYNAPQGSNRTEDLYGRTVDYNYRGEVRASVPAINYEVNLNVQALDNRSILDRSADIAQSIVKEIQLAHPVGREIRQAVLQG